LKHRVLIVGVGSIGERHLRCFRATGRADVLLCEINPERRHMVAKRYAVADAYPDLDAASRDQIDAAIIATPAPAHIPIARRLVDTGAHIMIEKPLSTSLHGIEAFREAVKKHGVVAAVAYVWRAHPLVTAMKHAIDEGRFGNPLQLCIVTGQHLPAYRPAYRDIYYAHREQGGGAIQDALTHMLNLGEWLVGPIERLVADAAHLRLPGVTVEDTAHLLARHGEVLGCYALNQHQAPNETTITLCCERGTCRALTHENKWQWMTEPAGTWHEQSIDPVERDMPFLRQANAFLDAVEGKRPPPCTLDEGVQTLRVNLAALQSAFDDDKFVRIEDVR